MLQIIFAQIEEDVKRLTGPASEAILPIQTLSAALLLTTALSDAGRLAATKVLAELVHDLAQAPDDRRTPTAIAYLVDGLRRIVAPVPELARLWADVERPLAITSAKP
jgi:hypothetical protein